MWPTCWDEKIVTKSTSIVFFKACGHSVWNTFFEGALRHTHGDGGLSIACFIMDCQCPQRVDSSEGQKLSANVYLHPTASLLQPRT